MLYCDAIIDAMNKGMGKQKISVQFNILTAILDVAFLYLLLPQYGMKGYFASFTITHLLNFILSLLLLLKTVKLKIPIRIPFVTALSALTAVILTSFVDNIIMKVIVYMLLYSSLLFLSGTVTWKEVRWLKGLLK